MRVGVMTAVSRYNGKKPEPTKRTANNTNAKKALAKGKRSGRKAVSKS
jgi:hypothetical protein